MVFSNQNNSQILWGWSWAVVRAQETDGVPTASSPGLARSSTEGWLDTGIPVGWDGAQHNQNWVCGVKGSQRRPFRDSKSRRCPQHLETTCVITMSPWNSPAPEPERKKGGRCLPLEGELMSPHLPSYGLATCWNEIQTCNKSVTVTRACSSHKWHREQKKGMIVCG